MSSRISWTRLESETLWYVSIDFSFEFESHTHTHTGIGSANVLLSRVRNGRGDHIQHQISWLARIVWFSVCVFLFIYFVIVAQGYRVPLHSIASPVVSLNSDYAYFSISMISITRGIGHEHNPILRGVWTRTSIYRIFCYLTALSHE